MSAARPPPAGHGGYPAHGIPVTARLQNGPAIYNAVHFPSRGSRGISYPLNVNHGDACVDHAETIMAEPTKRSLPGPTIRFDPEVKAAIEKVAKADKRSASSLVEIAVIAYLREKGFLPD